MSGTESPDFDRAAEGHQVLQEARQDRDEIKRLRAALGKALDLITERVHGRGFTQGQVAHDNYELGLRIKEIRTAIIVR